MRKFNFRLLIVPLIRHNRRSVGSHRKEIETMLAITRENDWNQLAMLSCISAVEAGKLSVNEMHHREVSSASSHQLAIFDRLQSGNRASRDENRFRAHFPIFINFVRTAERSKKVITEIFSFLSWKKALVVNCVSRERQCQPICSDTSRYSQTGNSIKALQSNGSSKIYVLVCSSSHSNGAKINA